MNAAAPIHRSRYGDVAVGPGGLEYSFRPSEELTHGSRQLAKDVCHRVGRLIRRHEPTDLKIRAAQVLAAFDTATQDDLQNLMADIDRCIDVFKKAKLHPRVVDEILGITPRERLRWIKDGRLPISGSGSLRRGRQDIRFPLHPPDKIAAIARCPELIAGWRMRDAEHIAPPNPRSSQALG